MRSIHVEDLLTGADRRLGLEPIVGMGGLGRPISSAKPVRPGRELRRQAAGLGANRVLILGKVELRIIQGLTDPSKRALFREISVLDVPCLIVEGSLSVPEDLRVFAQAQSIPMLGTRWSGPRLTRELTQILHDLLGRRFHVQGVLLRVLGVGVLIRGKSGIGKSECALDLVSRGHVLVADDFVEVSADPNGEVVGRSPELIRHHMEVRGLGIINILELFGPDAVADECPVELVVELVEWERFLSVDRTGLNQRSFTLLDADLPLLRIPVSLNRNVAIIVEVAAKNHLLQQKGIRPVSNLERRIESQLRSRAQS
jgi:HPr kinase/phosphorylase